MAKKRSTAYIFLDTNAYLEFKDFDQIDWPTFIQYQRVCLVIVPITLNELERFKYDQKSERRQSRSRLITKKLDQIIFSVGPTEQAPVPNRPNVTLLTLTDSPNVSLYPGLDSSIADDQLIASILKFREDHPEIDSQDVVLVGDDAGCLNKARARNIVARRLDDNFRLPVEPSAAQKELNQVKRQLQELQAKQPKLSLAVITNDKPSQNLATTITILQEPDEAVVKQLYESELRATHVDISVRKEVAENPVVCGNYIHERTGHYAA